VRKLQNQDLRAVLAWSINSGKVEFRPEDFPGFRRMRVAASFSGLKGQKSCIPQRRIFHRSNSSLLLSLVAGSRPPLLCAPFFTSFEATEFAEMGHSGEEGPSLPVSLLMREVNGIGSFFISLLLFCSGQ